IHGYHFAPAAAHSYEDNGTAERGPGYGEVPSRDRARDNLLADNRGCPRLDADPECRSASAICRNAAPMSASRGSSGWASDAAHPSGRPHRRREVYPDRGRDRDATTRPAATLCLNDGYG